MDRNPADYGYIPDEEDDFVLKEPIFREEMPKSSRHNPSEIFAPKISRTIVDALVIMGVFVATFVLADVASKLVSKWLD